MYFSTQIPSPIGEMTLITTNDHIVFLDFSDSSDFEKRTRLFVPIAISEENSLIKETNRQLEEYFSGQRKTFSVKVDPQGTDFQKKAWKALMQIPFGERKTYKDEATIMGNSKACRAV